MAVFSPLSSRRFANRKAKATQQLIVFRLYSEGFALPIRAVQKVISMGKIYGAPQGGAVGLTLYQDRELLVIDIDHRIFKGIPRQKLSLNPSSLEQEDAPPEVEISEVNLSDDLTVSGAINVPITPEPSQEDTGEGYLLIVQNRAGKLAGLPIADPPSLQRVPEEAFMPLTSEYMAQGNIRCVSALVVQNKEQPPLFLLNPDQLVQSNQALPPGSY
ncbi:MAG TPA: chemotaxis protein CheW [Cyanobacteria bacterium UBA8803]|nr:chemotaxis protein CheW [Cyanobacteria bacterium UBA9273]HBL59141.1 chemotaxis protein CheW [Cyanobacteria bacterium UBA8803]